MGNFDVTGVKGNQYGFGFGLGGPKDAAFAGKTKTQNPFVAKKQGTKAVTESFVPGELAFNMRLDQPLNGTDGGKLNFFS